MDAERKERRAVDVPDHVEVLADLANGAIARMHWSSVAGFMPGPYMAVYYASKAYVLSFSEALAAECAGRGVHVSALCPGPVATGFQANPGPGGTGVRYNGALVIVTGGTPGAWNVLWD